MVRAKSRSQCRGAYGHLLAYACEDADITFRLFSIFSEKLIKDGLQDVALNLDFPLSRVLAHMETNGIALDTKLLEEFSTALSEDMERLKSAIFEQWRRI